MSLEVVLAHPGLQLSRPQLVAGDPSRRTVRWVHSSEIYNIAPLLRGGELLLTTGLGLDGCDEGERRAYVRALADRGVAGLALELGQTFAEVPADMVDEARRLDLPLVLLREIYPFVEVTEQINSAILDSSVTRLRHADDVSRALSRVLAERGGLEALTAELARLLDRPVVVTDATGAVLAATTQPVDEVLHAPAGSATVTAHGTLLGGLVVGGGVEDDLVRAAMDRAPEIFAIELLRDGRQPLLAGRERRTVLRQLLSGARGGTDALVQHATASGVAADCRWVGLAVGPDDGQPALALVRDVAALPGVRVLAAPLDTATLAMLALPRGGADEALGRVRAVLDRARGPVVAVGPVVPVAAAGRSLRAARQALSLGELAPAGDRVLLAEDLVVERLLAAVPDPLQLEDLVQEQLGPLLAAPHTDSLVETLVCFLDSGCSKAATARALHLRRQSVHQRINRLETFLGDLADPHHQTALRLALAVRRAAGSTRGRPARG